jgi:hypothetical protein
MSRPCGVVIQFNRTSPRNMFFDRIALLATKLDANQAAKRQIALHLGTSIDSLVPLQNDLSFIRIDAVFPKTKQQTSSPHERSVMRESQAPTP